MQIRVSKIFASFINKTAKEMGFEAHAEVHSTNGSNYRIIVGDDVLDAWSYGDCVGDDLYKYIVVTYPPEYYVCPMYISSRMLYDEMHRLRVKDEKGLKEMIRDLVEV